MCCAGTLIGPSAWLLCITSRAHSVLLAMLLNCALHHGVRACTVLACSRRLLAWDNKERCHPAQVHVRMPAWCACQPAAPQTTSAQHLTTCSNSGLANNSLPPCQILSTEQYMRVLALLLLPKLLSQRLQLYRLSDTLCTVMQSQKRQLA
jgi:hypothetical protein